MLNKVDETRSPYKVVCLDCEEEIKISRNSKIGEIISCLFCEAQMRLLSLNPVRVDWAMDDDVLDDYDSSDDQWDDDDDDDWDDEDNDF